MKKIIVTVIVISTLLLASNMDTIKILKPFLAGWNPISVDLQQNILTIQTQETQVTDTIFNTIIKTGVCASLWIGDKKWSDIKEVHVLNKFKKQGYVFEGGNKECTELGKKSNDDSKWYLMGKTHKF